MVLEAAGMSFKQTSNFNFLGSVKGVGLISGNLAKLKGQLIRMRPYLRLRSLSTAPKAKLVEIFTDPIAI